MIENLTNLFKQHPMLLTFLKYLFWVILVLIIISKLRAYFRHKMPDTPLKYKTQKGIELIGYILIFFITVFYFSGNFKDLGVALGLLSAGLTVTFQEVILSIAGSLYIFFLRVYKPGDRIEINHIRGDVIDVDTIYTTMMEIGEWVSSDNYSGRIVKISNAFVFKGPVYNYSQDFPFVWDEFNIPIRYGSDVDLAKKIVIEVAQAHLSDYVQKSMSDWKNVVDKYYIEDADIHPTLAITLTDNWINFNLHYIVDYTQRRSTKHILNEDIGKRIDETNGKVMLASATFEVVGIPPLKIESVDKK
jgi:small-conductance mechanosensitive channel